MTSRRCFEAPGIGETVEQRDGWVIRRKKAALVLLSAFACLIVMPETLSHLTVLDGSSRLERQVAMQAPPPSG